MELWRHLGVGNQYQWEIEKGGEEMNLQAAWTAARMVQLTWRDRFDDEAGFDVMKSLNNQTFTSCANVGPNITSYEDLNVTNNTVYYYRIKALGPDS